MILGSLMLFAVLAAVMVVTLKVDWNKGGAELMKAAVAPAATATHREVAILEQVCPNVEKPVHRTAREEEAAGILSR